MSWDWFSHRCTIDHGRPADYEQSKEKKFPTKHLKQRIISENRDGEKQNKLRVLSTLVGTCKDRRIMKIRVLIRF
jgi:hypothetical protein